LHITIKKANFAYHIYLSPANGLNEKTKKTTLHPRQQQGDILIMFIKISGGYSFCQLRCARFRGACWR